MNVTPVFIEPAPYRGRIGFKVCCSCHDPLQFITMGIGATLQPTPSDRTLCARVLPVLPDHDGLFVHLYVKVDESWYEKIDNKLFELIGEPLWGAAEEDNA